MQRLKPTLGSAYVFFYLLSKENRLKVVKVKQHRELKLEIGSKRIPICFK